MLLLKDAKLERWSPDFSTSEQANPDWVRVRAGELVLCNALNHVDWSGAEVQVELCEECGVAGCRLDGWVQVVRTGEWVVWMKSRRSGEGEGGNAECEAVRRFGAIVIPEAMWNEWRKRVVLPLPEEFPAMTGGDVARLWLDGIPRPLRCQKLGEVVPLLRSRCVAADTLDLEQAIERVERVIKVLQDNENRAWPGRLVESALVGVRLERLYFDEPFIEPWTAVAEVECEFVATLSPEWVVFAE